MYIRMDHPKTTYYRSKYPKSINNRQCIGHCYEANKVITHPISLTPETNKDHPFCPVMEFTNPKTKKIQITDECNHATSLDEDRKEMEMSLITPYFDFNSTHFLKIYYGVSSFEDGIKYIVEHENIPYYTQRRILNALFNGYGSTITEIDSRLVTYYVKIIKERWSNLLLKNLGKFIKITGDVMMFTNKIGTPEEVKISNNMYLVEKINFLIEKLINQHVIQLFFEYYVKEMEGEWLRITNHIFYIKKNLIKYLTHIIENSNFAP